MLWTKGRAGGGGDPQNILRTPSCLALMADKQDHDIRPQRRPRYSPGQETLALRPSKANHSPRLRAREQLPLPALFGQGLATRAGHSPLPASCILQRLLSGYLQKGRQASICDLNLSPIRGLGFQGFSETLDSSTQFHVYELICIPSASARDHAPPQVKNMG